MHIYLFYICVVILSHETVYLFIRSDYLNNNNNNNKVSLLKHASTTSKAHKTKTGSGKGQASYIRPNIYAEKSNVCNLLLKQDIRLVLK